MKNVKQLFYTSLAFAAISFFSSCNKEGTPSSLTSAVPSSLTSARPSSDDMVITPAGMMKKSQVHFIGDGYQLSVVGGRLQKLEKSTGRMVEDFGVLEPLEKKYNIHDPSNSGNSVSSVLGLANDAVPAAVNDTAHGWIAYTFWSNPDTTKPITYYSTTWKVPEPPVLISQQTIFLFDGIQDGATSTSYIIQPVLQWGVSAAGGGDFWAETNWFVSGNQAFFGTLVEKGPTTTLQGVIQETATAGGNYTYTSSFVGFPTSNSITATNVPQATWAAETLEAYNVSNSNQQYPNSIDVPMSSIDILEGTTHPKITWKPVQAVSGSLQKAVVVSNSSSAGEVDIHLRNKVIK
jgi:hypothetical protein